MTPEVQAAARAALHTHDLLRAVTATEPECDSDGMPVDSEAWQEWFDGSKKPAYKAWDKAMNDLAAALGEPGLSRHPYNFRPRCAEILGEPKAATMREP